MNKQSIRSMKYLKRKKQEDKEKAYADFKMKLPKEIYSALQRNGINNIQDLLKKSDKEIAKIRNIGKARINILKKAIEENGFLFKDGTT
jgi:DNA-directed RNA polymerase alpha subunit